jgi:hypothetical protein
MTNIRQDKYMKEIKLCTKCILPETLPNISFNEQGVCNFCLDRQPSSVLGETKLKEIVYSKKGDTYDCVVPISGGKDSTYILYYAVKILNLRAIAVNYDSGVQANLAMENIKNTCARLNVPLVVIKADYKTQVKMLKEMLLVSQSLGAFYGFCGNCGTNIKTVAINTAKKYKVPFILSGGTSSEQLRGAFVTSIRKTIRRAPKRTALVILLRFMKYFYLSTRQRMQMKVPLKYRFRPRAHMHITNNETFPNKGTEGNETRFINIYDYIEWDPLKTVSLLEEQIGWKHPSEREGRFDCLVHCMGNHKWLQECGVSSDGMIYSRLVSTNHMSREDAISRENNVKETVEKECLEIIEKLGLTRYRMPSIRRIDTQSRTRG